MWSSYFKIAWRNLVNNRSVSMIHISGLATGMSVVLLLGLWIHDEITFNHVHSHFKQIGVMMVSETRDGRTGSTRITSIPLGFTLNRLHKDDFEFIVTATQPYEHILSADTKALTASGSYMQEDAAELFSLDMISGSRQGLNAPNSILISSSLARRFFGGNNPIGRVMNLNRKSNVTVTGVYKDLPDNSELAKVHFIAPWVLYGLENAWVKDAETSWRENFIKTYVQLKSPDDFDRVSEKIKDIKKNHGGPELAKRNSVVFIQPMDKWHLYSKFENGKVAISDELKLVYIYSIVGIVVLILACINFINLITARAEQRGKEVGVRKTLGSARSQLILQFFSECILICLFSFLLSIALTSLLIPWFNQVVGKSLALPWTSLMFWLICILFLSGTAIVAGLYPSVYISSFQPVKILKNNFIAAKYASLPRKILVVFQFSISIALMICTGIIFKQLKLAQSRPLGYEQNGLMELKFASSNSVSKSEILERGLKQAGIIQSMALTGGELTDVWSNNGGFEWRNKDPNQIVYFGTLSVSANFGKTIGWQVSAGRDFSPDLPTDSTSLILNESAVKLMGLESPVGEFIQRKISDTKTIQYQVIGVTKDLLMASPYEPAKPSVFFIHGNKNRTVIKLNPALNIHDALKGIETVHKKVFADAPFEYRFVDDAFGEKFKREVRMGTLATFFAFIAIFISCLGLFGVASYLAEKRTKEIGIRKVLGASVISILKLLSKEFISQIVLSIGISVSLAYFFMNKWLQNYSYRTNMPWWIFAVPILIASFILLLTVGVQALKSANANPIKALKVEG